LSTNSAEAPKESAINPAENPTGWLKARIERDAEPASSTGQSDTQASPAQPNVAESPAAVQPTSWRDTVIGDDVDHGFFKGKKVADAIESYKHSERAKQEAERRANDLQRQLESERIERQAELAARKVLAEQQQPRSTEQQIDPRLAEAESLWFENPGRARQLLTEYNEERAGRIAEERAAAAIESLESKYRTQSVAQQGENAFYAARDAMGVSPEVWDRRGVALLSTVVRKGSGYAEAGGPLNPAVLVQAYKDLFGDPTPASVANVPAAPAQLATPPGANKPARAAVPSGVVPSPMSDERRATYARLAERAGVPPEAFIKRREGRA
jgi:hypothetical protein